jgi:hypothetical protein
VSVSNKAVKCDKVKFDKGIVSFLRLLLLVFGAVGDTMVLSFVFHFIA